MSRVHHGPALNAVGRERRSAAAWLPGCRTSANVGRQATTLRFVSEDRGHTASALRDAQPTDVAKR
jgi:hypothetical protein